MISVSKKLFAQGIVMLIVFSTAVVSAKAQDTTGFQNGRKINDSTYEMTVQQAVDYAAKNSRQVRNALIGIKLQQQTNREITGSAYPQITGSGQFNYYPNVPVQSFPNFIAQATYGVLVAEGVNKGNGQPIVAPNDFGVIAAQFGTRYTASGGIDLNQLVFDGQVFVGLQARKTSIAYATKTAEVTQEQVKANVYKIYYQVVAGRQQVSTIDANIARNEKLLNDTREIFKNGFAEKLDVSKAEVSLTNLRTQKIRIENQLQTAALGLKLLLGMPSSAKLVLTDTLPEKLFSEDMVDTRFDYHERVEYEQLQLNKRLNEYNVKRYKLSYLPTLSIVANYSQLAQRNEFNFFKSSEPWFPSSFLGLRLNVPIFDGFVKDARIKTAKLQLEQTKNNIENLELSIDKEINESRINLRSAVATMTFQKRNMVLAEEVYNQTKLKFEQGLGSNLEITNAQAELTTAQNNYYTALYDAIVARIELQRVTGKL
jgi:outer membrane protein